jgi:hypothetical protein
MFLVLGSMFALGENGDRRDLRGGTFARIGVIFVRTGGSSIRPFRGETTRKPIKFAETCGTTREMCGLTGGTWFVIVATSGMIAATSGTTAEGRFSSGALGEGCANGGRRVLPPCLAPVSRGRGSTN